MKGKKGVTIWVSETIWGVTIFQSVTIWGVTIMNGDNVVEISLRVIAF